MIDFENKSKYVISDLLELMRILRSPQGCPWDREQTHKSIRRNLLEEAYEAASAIDEGDTDNLLEELGDVLLQVVFHSGIAQGDGTFTFDDVVDATCKKLLRRHPHVFGSISAQNGEDSLNIWEDIKREEKNHQTVSDSMDAVAGSLPALWRAEKVQKKAAKAGFDWPDSRGALDALRSETGELEEAVAHGSSEAISDELGDILFSAVNAARLLGVDPEAALNASSDKFVSRFRTIEETARTQGRSLTDMSSVNKLTLDEMEDIYQKAKKQN